jgi:hypothetical protein
VIDYGELTWAPEEIPKALGLDPDQFLKRADGRTWALIAEAMMAEHVVGGTLTPRGSPYDVLGPDGVRYEVRCLTHNIAFSPSSCRGTGRVFDEIRFLDALDRFDYYLVVDVQQSPLRWWRVDVDLIEEWWVAGMLGGSGRVTRGKFLKLVGWWR